MIMMIFQMQIQGIDLLTCSGTVELIHDVELLWHAWARYSVEARLESIRPKHNMQGKKDKKCSTPNLNKSE